MSGLTLPSAGIGVWEGARVLTPQDGAGIVTDVSPDNEYGITVSFGRGDRRPLGYLPRDLHLDLTHHPTRLEVTARAANRLCPQHAPVMCAAVMAGNALWPDRLVYGISVTSLLSGEEWHSLDQHIPALADLDPTDDTRLADGARVVDVQALAIVAARAFGGPS